MQEESNESHATNIKMVVRTSDGKEKKGSLDYIKRCIQSSKHTRHYLVKLEVDGVEEYIQKTASQQPYITYDNKVWVLHIDKYLSPEERKAIHIIKSTVLLGRCYNQA